MARGKKSIPNHLKKRLERGKRKRRENVLPKRKYLLIVCEGAKTEPLYFEGFKSDLPKGVLRTTQIDIEGAGDNTLRLIEKIVALCKDRKRLQGSDYDQVWAVFDRDSFPPEHFNSAIAKCSASSPEIFAAWSNEAFELWYLLHFQFFQNAMNRVQYGGLIARELSKKMGKKIKYAKNSPEMYQLLKEHGDIDQAIQRAESLEKAFEGRSDFADHNPCTRVYHLIRELHNLMA